MSDTAALDSLMAPEGKTVQVHIFPDSGTAYDETQWRDDIHDGDVLYVPQEHIVGFLYEACPCALTKNNGHLHDIKAEWFNDENVGKYINTLYVATRMALIEDRA